MRSENKLVGRFSCKRKATPFAKTLDQPLLIEAQPGFPFSSPIALVGGRYTCWHDKYNACSLKNDPKGWGVKQRR